MFSLVGFTAISIVSVLGDSGSDNSAHVAELYVLGHCCPGEVAVFFLNLV